MKTCKKCLREYDDGISVHNNPVHELGELFWDASGPERENDAGKKRGFLLCSASANN